MAHIWVEGENQLARKTEYITAIEVRAENRNMLLAELMECITDTKIALYALNAKTGKANIAIVNIKLRI